jgi:predicted peptidase
LIVFLIGTGERGHSLSLLTKHGPLRTVLDGQPLPFIIVSPMLEVSPDFRSFPEAYLDKLMNEILADYRVDPQRIYLTGLSMGGEATYRYALHRPELFAALAPLAAFDPKYLPGSTLEGFKPFTQPWNRIAEIPVWAVHGSADPVVPLFAAQQTVDALSSAGGQVRFTVIDGGGHNIWTDFYSDQAFYDWLLAQSKP